VDQLTLTETLEAEDLTVGLQGVSGDLVGVNGERTDDTASLVGGSILVKLVKIDLEVLNGLGEAEGIKSTVAWERAIQPVGACGVRKPKCFTYINLRRVEPYVSCTLSLGEKKK